MRLQFPRASKVLLAPFNFTASVAAETCVSTKIDSFNREQLNPLHHFPLFPIGLCSKDELWGINCKDIASVTDSKTISGANITGTILAPFILFYIQLICLPPISSTKKTTSARVRGWHYKRNSSNTCIVSWS